MPRARSGLTSAKLFGEPLTGIIPPLITPLRSHDTLDVGGLERLIEHVLAGEVSGLFLLGTTGEGVHLSYRLRRQLIQRVCRQVHRRVPVFVGVSDTAFVEAVALGRYAADTGADAVVLAPPYYLPLSQAQLVQYVGQLVTEVPLPLLLYNFPTLTKTKIELNTVRQLMANPRVVGIKDTSGDMKYFRRLVTLTRQRPNWTVLVGPEEKLAEAVLAGGHGGVNGGANLFPALYVELCRAARSNDVTRARQLQNHVLRVSRRLYRIARHSAGFIQGLKAALHHLGICDDTMSVPWQRFSKKDRKRVARVVEELKATTDKVTSSLTGRRRFWLGDLPE